MVWCAGSVKITATRSPKHDGTEHSRFLINDCDRLGDRAERAIITEVVLQLCQTQTINGFQRLFNWFWQTQPQVILR